MAIVSFALNISIDREFGSPSHGIDVLDGINARDKSYLR